MRRQAAGERGASGDHRKAGRLGSLKSSRISEAEWKARVDLAALFRLTALYGWDDLIFTHISARIPGNDKHYLINPFGLCFEEITASSLLRIDFDGNVVENQTLSVPPAGFTLHSSVHAARANANYVMHLHSDECIAVSSYADGLLPLTQHALITLPYLAYHTYEGIELLHDERERLVANLGEKTLMLLRHHGALATGLTAGECWMGMFYLERACKLQILTIGMGDEKAMRAPEVLQAEVREALARGVGAMSTVGLAAWPASLRRLDREMPGYDL
jgi:ribulose-5-phosphate 4-epimerase/fuculose-1-phosphate aldolase